jgi:hypothetical protein
MLLWPWRKRNRVSIIKGGEIVSIEERINRLKETRSECVKKGWNDVVTYIDQIMKELIERRW